MNVDDVISRYRDSDLTFDTISKTDYRTAPRGWMTSSIEKLLKAGRSHGITVGVVLAVLAVLSFLAGIMCGIRYDRSRNDTFDLNGQRYMMIGIGEVPGTTDTYIPVYKTEAQILKDQAQGR